MSSCPPASPTQYFAALIDRCCHDELPWRSVWHDVAMAMSDIAGPVKLDFSSFYKFAASVGLLLIAASVAVPWFVLRASVPEAVEGTDTAKIVDIALGARAEQYLFIIRAYPWFTVALFTLGCALTAYGLLAWRGRQKKQDDDEDEAYRQRRKLGRTTQASDDDRNDKLEREVLNDGADAATAEKAPARPDASPPRISSPTKNPADEKYRSRRDYLKNAEARAAQLLAEAFEDTHSVEAGVRIGGVEAPILDLVARAHSPAGWSSFAVEIRLSGSSNSAYMRLREVMLAVAIAARNIPEGPVQVQRVGRPPLARSVSICILIATDDFPGPTHGEPRAAESRPRYVARIEEIVKQVNSVLLRKVGIMYFPQTQFETLSAARLREDVLEVMRHPEQAVIRHDWGSET